MILTSSAPTLALPDALQGAVVVIGNFDGVHLGHQDLLAQARAACPGRLVVALTFEPHPRAFFAASKGETLPPFRLTPWPIKADYLQSHGADGVVALAFDAVLSALSAADFVEDIMLQRLRAAHVVVGAGFRFGAKRAGSASDIEAAGCPVTVAPLKCDDSGKAYSSGRARDAVTSGDFLAARAVLGRPWTIDGVVERGEQRGRTLGYPTANQSLTGWILPPYGIYAARVQVEGDPRWRDGVASLGIRPMFSVPHPLLETHIFDFGEEIYDKKIRVQPVARLREEVRFPDLPALVAQMKKDCLAARSVLKSASL